MYIDSHCHINFPELAAKMPEILAKMAENKVTHALCVSVDLPDFPQVLKLAKTYPHIYASVGVHPDYEDTPEPTVDDLVRLSDHPKIIAIGETGLDYFRLKGDLEWQRERFRRHIRASRATGKPLIIHTRAASEDTIKIMREEGAGTNAGGAGGVMHCFTESLAVAEAAIEMGFYISFSGIVTFKSAKDLQAVALEVPLERTLIETDSPYLAPVPYRGRMNEPGLVVHVAEYLANLKGLPVAQVAQQTTDNFFTLFKLPQEIAHA
ncbi:TatD family hydrolase [Glaciimonas sp. Gout2]|uniref:TatD family hydrolase n=1 Tax=unclassified Glaciimonas TaxID=2644401 RepID=UPI002AB4AE10|nr:MULTISPECIES: TatD family hydrolase [unclassified Glaciimonas]MDY7547835.1 TatD family hydrolase [Glaciimonas sp. CA11.2]MEB0010009.1 TatD family hydrolase [Glaciimonas sp. Cout2]MEB0081876.1 TatD family hydrolase [Glaciimonas sp. Gout2]